MIIGQRSNGKTYACIRKALEYYLQHNTPSAYLRRYATDLNRSELFKLISPHEDYLKKYTKNKYNTFIYKSHCFYLAYIDANGELKYTDDSVFLYCLSLNNWERQKGQDRGKIAYIIYDEFLTRSGYLDDEFSKFCNVISTLIRTRKGSVIYMIGNTVNEYSIYWDEMGITNIRKIKKGDIYLYTYNNDKLTVALEYCHESEQSKNVEYYYAFDNAHLDMIKKGNWETDNYPHLDFKLDKTALQYRFLLCFSGQWVCGDIHQQYNRCFIFYHDCDINKQKIDDSTIIYINKQPASMLEFNTFCISRKLKVTSIISDLMNRNMAYYSSNRVGEVVRNFILNPYKAVK